MASAIGKVPLPPIGARSAGRRDALRPHETDCQAAIIDFVNALSERTLTGPAASLAVAAVNAVKAREAALTLPVKPVPTIAPACGAECYELKVSLCKPNTSDELGIWIAAKRGKDGTCVQPYITRVAPSGLAGRSGELLVGDTIVGIDGAPVYSSQEVKDAVQRKAGFMEITLRRRRNANAPPPPGERRLHRHIDDEGHPF